MERKLKDGILALKRPKKVSTVRLVLIAPLLLAKFYPILSQSVSLSQYAVLCVRSS